ncbi:SMI1/KNR4 family protein [Shewanella oncorhynchi]|uniref:SMI1/KNR4 family protein n=1 Tax=Shewanella oncorhynchi TaxID=2726434 RepID=UPI0039F01C4A
MNIEDIELYFGAKLPRSYREFISTHKIESEGDVHLNLPEDIIERNECYETKRYAPGYINIGDNGGGEAFILKLSEEDPEVSIIGHGSMDPELKEFVYKDFSSWLASGLKYEIE